jgi:hypothetical protein
VPLFRFPFRAMATEHELQVDAPDERGARRAADAAIADVLRIEAKYSRYRDDSVTTAINRAAGGAPVAIDAETAALLRYAAQCHALSDGAFDITSGVLRRAWNFRAQPPKLPDPAAIDAALALIGWPRVEWDERSVRLPDKGMEIDFGGIGKEYAADRAATAARAARHRARARQSRRRRAGAGHATRWRAMAGRDRASPRTRRRDRRGRARRCGRGHERRLRALLRDRRAPLLSHPRSAHGLARRSVAIRERGGAAVHRRGQLRDDCDAAGGRRGFPGRAGPALSAGR